MAERIPEQGEPAERHQAVVVGAGPAGLAAAAMLGRRGIETLPRRSPGPEPASWRSHYGRLHLHTVRWLSGLPGMPISRSEGPWVAREDDQIPILDVGLIGLLKAGKVRVVGSVEGFDATDVLLAEGERLRPYAVIAATGFRRGLEPLVGHLGLVGSKGRPVVHGAETHPAAPNLFFIGFSNPISGNLREIGIDARRIARAVARGAGPGSAGRSLLSSSRWSRYRAPLPDARTS